MNTPLFSLNDDILIYLFSFLSPPNIVRFRQTCKRLLTISNLRIVWTNACIYHVLLKAYPFPRYYLPLEDVDVSTLERSVIDAYTLSRNWQCGRMTPREERVFSATISTQIHYVKFINRGARIAGGNGDPSDHGRSNLLLTVSQTIWSTFLLWDLDENPPRRCSEWSSRGAIFKGFCMNEDPSSDALLAVAYLRDELPQLELLQLYVNPSGVTMLRTLKSFPTLFRPVTLKGDLLAITNDIAQTTILNWQTGSRAILQHSTTSHNVWGAQDVCHQVVFAYHSILVISARSMHLFPVPILHGAPDLPEIYRPIAQHSFGWIESACASLPPPHCPYAHREQSTADFSLDDGANSDLVLLQNDSLKDQPISILIRAERETDWDAEVHTIRLFTLLPNHEYVPPIEQPPVSPSSLPSPSSPDSRSPTTHISSLPQPESPESSPREPAAFLPHEIPYIFPPAPTSHLTSTHGAIRFPGVILGPRLTAIWLQPQDRAACGLVWQDGFRTTGTAEATPMQTGPIPGPNSNFRSTPYSETTMNTPQSSSSSSSGMDLQQYWRTAQSIPSKNERRVYAYPDYGEVNCECVVGVVFGGSLTRRRSRKRRGHLAGTSGSAMQRHHGYHGFEGGKGKERDLAWRKPEEGVFESEGEDCGDGVALDTPVDTQHGFSEGGWSARLGGSGGTSSLLHAELQPMTTTFVQRTMQLPPGTLWNGTRGAWRHLDRVQRVQDQHRQHGSSYSHGRGQGHSVMDEEHATTTVHVQAHEPPPGHGRVQRKLKGLIMYRNCNNNWSALDYDEETGRVALGSRGGQVTLLQM